MTHLIDTNKIHEYKECVSRNCNNEATYQLVLFFAKKPGWFCASCMNYFKKEDLIKSTINENSIGCEDNFGRL